MRLLVDEKDFRIVQTVVDGNDVYILEVPDGADALGVERWRTFKTPSSELRAMFRYMVQLATRLEQLGADTHGTHE